MQGRIAQKVESRWGLFVDVYIDANHTEQVSHLKDLDELGIGAYTDLPWMEPQRAV